MRLRPSIVEVTLAIGVICSFWFATVPMSQLEAVASHVSPSGAILPKTVVLLRALRVAIPFVGFAVLTWLLLPKRWSASVAGGIYRALQSQWTVIGVVALGVAVRIAWLTAYPTVPPRYWPEWSDECPARRPAIRRWPPLFYKLYFFSSGSRFVFSLSPQNRRYRNHRY